MIGSYRRQNFTYTTKYVIKCNDVCIIKLNGVETTPGLVYHTYPNKPLSFEILIEDQYCIRDVLVYDSKGRRIDFIFARLDKDYHEDGCKKYYLDYIAPSVDFTIDIQTGK